jgi:hypothetical protein
MVATVALVLFGLSCQFCGDSNARTRLLFLTNAAAAGKSQDLNENQGLSQPDAPGAHHNVKPGTPKPAPGTTN